MVDFSAIASTAISTLDSVSLTVINGIAAINLQDFSNSASGVAIIKGNATPLLANFSSLALASTNNNNTPIVMDYWLPPSAPRVKEKNLEINSSQPFLLGNSGDRHLPIGAIEAGNMFYEDEAILAILLAI
ncbi:MAG: hypothetical protein ACOYK8_00435 [Alphaproteobacteria bacterium]